jgi:hypothetical protein
VERTKERVYIERLQLPIGICLNPVPEHGSIEIHVDEVEEQQNQYTEQLLKAVKEDTKQMYDFKAEKNDYHLKDFEALVDVTCKRMIDYVM